MPPGSSRTGFQHAIPVLRDDLRHGIPGSVNYLNEMCHHFVENILGDIVECPRGLVCQPGDSPKALESVLPRGGHFGSYGVFHFISTDPGV